MARVHLFQALVQGRDENWPPVTFNRPLGLSISTEPGPERFSGPIVVIRPKSHETIRDSCLVDRAKEAGKQKADGQVKWRREAGCTKSSDASIRGEKDDLVFASKEFL
ncbi:MAG: hypothetical protein NVSMB9_06780 [Isosphaeraceae bacterium]